MDDNKKNLSSYVDDTYNRYSELFKNENYAKNYHNLSSIKSISEALDPKKLAGWIVAKFEIRAIDRMLKFCRGNLIIDVPCGSGKLFPKFLEKKYDFIGIDASGDMLSNIQNSFLIGLNIIQADIRNLPLRNDYFDVIVSNRFLHRIPPKDHEAALKEFHRISKNYLIVYFSVETFFSNVIYFLERVLNIGDRGEIFYISQESIKEELDLCGWSVLKTTTVLPLISTGYVVVAKKKEK